MWLVRIQTDHKPQEVGGGGGRAGDSVIGCFLYMPAVLFTFFKEDRLTWCSLMVFSPDLEGTPKHLLKDI